MFPVVCAAPLSKELMNRFIKVNDVKDDHWNLVFVDRIDEYYYEESMMPIEDDSDPNSPFIGKTPEECHQLLLKLCEDTESEILTPYFAIMDERSTQDDTVLLVCACNDLEGEPLPLETIRASFQASASSLMCYLSGHSSVEEDAGRAEREHDNVYRGR